MREIYTSIHNCKFIFALVVMVFFTNNLLANDGNKPGKPKQKDVLTINISQQSISCYGELDGKAFVTVVTGTAPFTYTWSNGGTTDTINNLLQGTYSVTVEDSDGFTATASIDVQEPGLLFATVLLSDSVLSCEITELTATIEPIGGTLPFTYAWSFPQGVIETGQTVNIYQPANYPYTVTDARGCTFSSDTSVGSENIPIVTLYLIDTVNCNGQSNGSAYSVVSGGIEPYSYDWSNGTSNDSLLNVSSGSYSVTVTDAAGCTGQAFVFIPQPNTLILTVTGNDVTCFGQSTGAIFTTVIGGTPDYDYTWSNGSNSPQLNNLEAGLYELTVTDAHGCSVTGGVTITEGNEINIFTSATPVKCFGGNNGQAIAFATGGSGVFMYAWSNGATGAQVQNLTAGTYTLFVTDFQNCVESTTVVIVQPEQLILTMNSTPEILGGQDGTAGVAVTGGVQPYSYLWETGSVMSFITGLDAGAYTVTVTDHNGCSNTDSTVVVESNCAFSGTLLLINPTCFGEDDGAVFPQISVPGLEPYFYQWSTGSNDPIQEGLSAGSYSVTIYDNANCIITLNGLLTNPAPVDVQFQVTQPTGPDNPTGSITVFISGGQGPYKVNYNGTDYPGGNTITVSNIPSGPQSVVVRDSKGCSFTIDFVIDQFDCQLVAHINKIAEPLCFGLNTGKLCAEYDNNFGDVTIQWSNDQTTDCIDGLGAGSYKVTIKDTLGCTVVKEMVIEQPDFITLSNVNINPGTGNFDGFIKLNVIGGTPPFTYTWKKNGEAFATTRDIAGLNAGTYTLQVIDSKGCEVTFEPIALVPSANHDIDVSKMITLYPNPVNTILNIESDAKIGDIQNVYIIDVRGNRSLLKVDGKIQRKMTADISNMPGGAYIIGIQSDKGMYYSRLIKM